MALRFEELRVLQAAETVADGIWQRVVRWDPFARKVVGEQMARAGDSVGANIAEAYGRFRYGDKLRFLHYARGSLFETKYWLNRTQQRNLMAPEHVQRYTDQLTDLARQLNAFATGLKAQRRSNKPQPSATREAITEHSVTSPADVPTPHFTEEELRWLQTMSNT